MSLLMLASTMDDLAWTKAVLLNSSLHRTVLADSLFDPVYSEILK